MNARDLPGNNGVEASPARVRTCAIFARPTGASQYGWGWECGDKKSQGLFRYFYDCVQDARKHGYAVDFAAVAESLKAPRIDSPTGD